jgi:hypothetical protein
MNINIKTNLIGANKHKCRSPAILALALVGVVGSLGAVTPAWADTLYKTGFENPPFVAGTPLLQFVNPSDPTGLDGWGNIPPLLNPAAAFITNIAAKSGRQSVEVAGASLISSVGQTGPYDAIGSYRRSVNHTISGNKSVVRIDADMLLKTNKPKTPGEFFSLTLAARSGVGETLGEIGLASNGIVEAWLFNAPGGSAPAFTKPIRFNKWYHITMLHDFKHETTTYFIDDRYLGSTPAPSAEPNVLLRGAMVVYARPDGADAGGPGSLRSDYTARFDNFRISVHKEAPEID